MTRQFKAPIDAAPDMISGDVPERATPETPSEFRHFLHNPPAATLPGSRRRQTALLAAVLADGTNLGLARMADASRGLSYLHLVNVAQWHISDDNYVAARAAIINAHHRHPMSAIWDDGTTWSSDGQYFRAGGREGAGGSVDAKLSIGVEY